MFKKNKPLKPKLTIQQWLPFKDVGSNYIIDNNGDYIVPISLGAINISLLSYDEKDNLIHKLMSIYNAIDYPFQILLMDKPVNLELFLNKLEELKNSTDDVVKKRIIQQDLQDAYHLISKENSVEKSYYFLFKVPKIEKEKIVFLAKDVIDYFKGNLNLETRLCTERDIREMIYIWANPEFTTDSIPNLFEQPIYANKDADLSDIKLNGLKTEKESKNTVSSFKDLISPLGLQFTAHDIQIGEQYSKVLYIRQYPKEISGAWLSEVAQKSGVQISIHATPVPSYILLNAMKNTLSTLEGKKYSDKSYEREMAKFEKETVKEFIYQVNYQQQRVFNTTICVTISARSKEELLSKTKDVQAYFSSKELSLKECSFYQQQGLITASPFVKNELSQIYQNLTSLTLASSFPFVKNGFKDETGMVLGTDDNDGLMTIDFWKRHGDRTSTNMLFLGKTGMGKSATSKKIMRAEYARGTKVISLDPEKENVDFAKNIGGDVVNASNGNIGRINPMEIRALSLTDDEDDESNQNALGHHISFLRSFFEIYKELSNKQSDLLEYYITKLYTEKFNIQWNVDPKTVTKEQTPILSDLYDFIEEDNEKEPTKDKHDLLLALYSCSKGADSFTLNGHTTLSINSDFVVIDCNELMDKNKQIKNAQLFNIITWCWNEVSRDRDQRVLLHVEEFYLFADEHIILVALRNMMKRARKYNGAIALATQDLVDFVSQDIIRYGQALFDNTTYKFIFGQGDKGVQALVDLYPTLSDGEVSLISKGKRGSCLFACGTERANLNVRLTNQEEDLFGKGGGK